MPSASPTSLAKLTLSLSLDISLRNGRPTVTHVELLPAAPQPATFNQPSTVAQTLHAPTLYALRKGLGVWHLTFDGRSSVLKHERGLFYIAWLLHHPAETPIHALDLMARIPDIYRHQLGLAPFADPATGKPALVESHARLQERSLALDDAETVRALFKKEKELEATLDSDDASEPEKAEALRDLEAIAQFQRQHARRSQDSAQRTVRTVRMAIARLQQHLFAALEADGRPHPILRPFAEHIREHLLIPSARDGGPGGSLPGCFTYEPLPGLIWAH